MGSRRLTRRRALSIQICIVVLALLAWQFVPDIPGIGRLSVVFDREFVSSPSQLAALLVQLARGDGVAPIWPYVQETLQNALVGTSIGLLGGALLGLLMSNDERLSQVIRPFVVATNSIPRIALIPLIVIIVGPNARATMIAAAITAFFSVFWNAYEGGRTVAPHVLDNAAVQGASRLQLMRHVRLPYVIAWSFAAMPNALSHGLLSTVTAEVFTGHTGLGRQLFVALISNSVTLTFAIALIMAVSGLALVLVADQVQRRVLHWWVAGRA